MSTKLVMLGAAPETRGSIAAVVDTYRAHGLFKRWPITYVATHGFKGAGEFTSLIAQRGRVALHLHTATHASFWRDSAYLCAAIAARCPVLLHLHGADFDRFHDACSTPSRAAIRFFFEHAAYVAAPTERTAAWVRSVAPAAHAAYLPTPVGGIPEVVVDGVTGFLAAPGDVGTLELRLRKLLLDRSLAAAIGAAGRETVRLRFAPERALPQLEEIYADLGLRSPAEPPAARVNLRSAA